jgi:prepilin-type processing-associated H-X9-DG protein
VDMYPQGVRMEARPENLKVRDALHSCVFLGKIDKRQRKDVWPHASGINAGYVDGSVQLVNLSPTLARTTQELYDENVIRRMDYFTFCFFRMLSGDRKWIEAFPERPSL